LAGLPHSLPISQVYAGLVMARELEQEREQSLAMTLFGFLRVKQEGGTVLDMAPHVFPQETREAVEQEQARETERVGQMQQLMILKRLSEMDGN
jgi:hypothetical protein